MPLSLTNIGLSQSATQKQKATQNVEEMFAKHRFNKDKGALGVQKHFDDHIKLICAYVMHQTPNDNMDPEKFMQATFQMLNTEQIIMMNKLTSESQDLQKRLAKAEESRLVNREVKVETEGFVFDDKPIEFEYELPQKVNNPVLEIYAANNLKNPIHQVDLDPDIPNAGIVWDGRLHNGEKANSGEYVIKVSGSSKLEKNENGQPLKIYGKTALFTVIDYIPTDNDSDEQFYVSGKMLISEKDIKGIRKKISNPYDNKKTLTSTFSQTDDEKPLKRSSSTQSTNDADIQNVSFSTISQEHENLAHQTINQEI
ncbi:MAG: hypothetical protein KBD31_04595 [Proteobacteria bacterium]|nr:hypothetical protein [Pseudomonadota bacterium]